METLVHYSNPIHGCSLLGVLNEQRMKGQLCDVVLLVGDQQYQAHKSILAACSDYFQSVFSKRDSESIIHLDFCEPDAFEIVLNYIYSSSLFVEKCTLAAIQELGYSLGIPYLTNIMSVRPQVSYNVSRKQLVTSEEEDGARQNRSVIVHQSQEEPSDFHTLPTRTSNSHGKSHKHTPLTQDFSQSSGHSKPKENIISVSQKSSKTELGGDCGSIISAPTPILGHRTDYRSTLSRPLFTSSVSFAESLQCATMQSDCTDDDTEDKVELSHNSRPAKDQQSQSQQSVDRSGPLIKSLLRRSLSMDSPVPVFSPALELKDSPSKEESICKLVTESEESPYPESDNIASTGMPSSFQSRSGNDHESQGSQTSLRIKAEPSSPLADPSEIVRITIGEKLPVSFKDFQPNYDENPKGYYTSLVKRRRMDDDFIPFKMTTQVKEHRLSHQSIAFSDVPCDSNMDNSNEEPGELRPNKMFKCWSCLKVFRSSAGLYRHVNMYHNPDKPYACEICHKRFHTNFKVWTHCQNQHGVMQSPSQPSGSYSVLDEKFQRKLIDIVREREIKKALIMKLRRSKQGLQSQPWKSRRSKPYSCPFCGKMFFFQAHLKLHMKGHSLEPTNLSVSTERDLQSQPQQMGHLKESQDQDVFSCRTCNKKLLSLADLEDHEKACRYSTVCPYCSLRFSNALVKKDHEVHCKYKKLTCLECMRTFKSSFSIWRHQVEVHNHNMMSAKEQLGLEEGLQDGSPSIPPSSQELPCDAGEEAASSDSSAPSLYDSDSTYVPEDLSSSHGHGELRVKEEPEEEPVSAKEAVSTVAVGSEESTTWPCEKCGNHFRSHKDLERHQELLCHIKPFICHICDKAFRTNFRLWSHYQSHMPISEEPEMRAFDRLPCSPSPSPPLTIAIPECPSLKHPPLQVSQSVADTTEQPRGSKSPLGKPRTRPEQAEDKADSYEPAPHLRKKSSNKASAPQEANTLFYHAPPLSTLAFKRQYMCKVCHRTFKSAFSLWSHEQSHA